MASTSRPRDSQISWPVPISVATAVKRVVELLDVQIAELALEAVAQPLPVDQPGAGEIEIEVAEDAAARQLAGEPFQLVEMSGCIAGADHGADRSAGDDVRFDAGLGESFEDADVGPAACRAAPQRKPDLSLGHVLHLL